MTLKHISQIVAEKVCVGCPYLNRCFDDKEPCDKYNEEYDKLKEKH